jgi:hypothetical protein
MMYGQFNGVSNAGNTSASCNFGQTDATGVIAACWANNTVGGNAFVNNRPAISWPGVNCLSVITSAAMFVNYNNGFNGDYTITAPCHHIALDGKDPGADLAKLATETLGVTAFGTPVAPPTPPVPPPTPGAANWQLVATTPGGAANIMRLAFDASNNMFLADMVSGVWTNRSGSWVQVNTGLATLAVQSIVFNPINGDMVAGTRGTGLTHSYRLPSGGTTWTQIPEPAGFTNTVITAQTGCVVPNASSNKLICGGLQGPASNTGLYSTDNGVTTHLISEGTNSAIYSIYYNPILGTYYLGSETQGLLESTDGINFVGITPTSPGTRVGNVKGQTNDASGIPLFSSQGGVWKCQTTTSCMAPSNPLGNGNTSAGDGLYRDSLGSIYYGHNKDTVNPITVYRSLDQGATWQDWSTGINSASHLTGHQFIENLVDGKIYAVIIDSATNAGAVYSSTK